MNLKKILSKDLVVVALFVAILSIIIIPLPKGILDFFLVISLSLSLLILLISLYIQKPSDLTTFPTLILILALFRLSLNIATIQVVALVDWWNLREKVIGFSLKENFPELQDWTQKMNATFDVLQASWDF